MPLDPQVETVLEIMSAAGVSFADLEVSQARELMEQLAAAAPPGEPVASVEDRSVPGPGGAIPVRVYRPAGDVPPPVVVFFHGGGWTIGSIQGHDATCRALANRSGCVVVSVGYRLGPEHWFPAGVEDADAATRWVAQHAAELGGRTGPIGVAGDSAGGNLAAVVSLLARDRGVPAIGHQLLVYPATDARDDWPSYRENGEGYFLTLRDMQWFVSHYLNDDAERDDFRMSPLRAESHAGLPPAFVVTAEFDPLRDEGNAYAERLRAAGVPATLRCYQGMIHGFWSMAAMLDRGREAMDDAAAEVRRALA